MRLNKGVEEEVMVGTLTGHALPLSQDVCRYSRVFRCEPDARIVEYSAGPSRDEYTLVSELIRKRLKLRRYLKHSHNATIIPGSSLLLGESDSFYQSDPDNSYYRFIEDYYFTRVVTAGTHLHFEVGDTDVLFRILRVLRCEASLFLAITAASPFLNSMETGYCSTRWKIFPKNPAVVPFFGNQQEYALWLKQAILGGLMQNHRHLWGSARLNGPHLPEFANRVELRICDQVLSPTLLRALILFLEFRILSIMQDPHCDPKSHDFGYSDEELNALCQRNETAASIDGIRARLHCWRSGQLRTVEDWLNSLASELQPIVETNYPQANLLETIDVLSKGGPAHVWLASSGSIPIAQVVERAISLQAEQDYAYSGLRESCEYSKSY